MSAGTGVRHSEFNASDKEGVHFLQIWIEPSRRGVEPGYEEKRFEPETKRGRLRLVASPDGAEGSVSINQDARLYATLLDGADRVGHAFAPGRRGYVHVVRGELDANGERLGAGDALALAGEKDVRLENARGAEVLLFDLP
jgi:redox-sensitive bicupin YhaK (pirin superfamily)